MTKHQASIGSCQRCIKCNIHAHVQCVYIIYKSFPRHQPRKKGFSARGGKVHKFHYEIWMNALSHRRNSTHSHTHIILCKRSARKTRLSHNRKKNRQSQEKKTEQNKKKGMSIHILQLHIDR